jgi:anionic cell wall polymer biosynthesis LytR-Cps2A-Psr (LCP) family protein
MKKILVLLVGIVSLFGTAIGQSLTVSDVEFTSNPSKFNNQIVTINSVKLNLSSNAPVSISVPTEGAKVSTGAGTPSSKSTGKTVRCNAPRGFRSLQVDLLNNQPFNVCFFISDAMYTALPKGQPTVNAQITFRGDNNFGYVINLYKLK